MGTAAKFGISGTRRQGANKLIVINPAASTAPVISGLVISPSATYASPLPLRFTTRFDFTDPDGNLASLTLKILDGSRVTVDHQTLPVQGTEGLTEGTILGDMVTNAVHPDTYTAQIDVPDATGLQSNTLALGAMEVFDPVTQLWSTLMNPCPRRAPNWPWTKSTASCRRRLDLNSQAIIPLKESLYALPPPRQKQPESLGPLPGHHDVCRPDRAGRSRQHRRRCPCPRRELHRHG